MGAQGGSAEMALAGSGGDGLGSLVVCSRSLLYPKVEGDLFETETENCIRQTILETKQSLDDVLKPKIKARLRQQELIAKNKDVALLLKNAQDDLREQQRKNTGRNSRHCCVRKTKRVLYKEEFVRDIRRRRLF